MTDLAQHRVELAAKSSESVTFRNLWLLWLAAASATCLPPIGTSPFVGLIIASALIMLWIGTNVTPKRIIYSIFTALIEIFFREIGVRNQFKVPPQGSPCLFVCAPHANQFLDPFVVVYAVGRLDLCFLNAAKSMRKRVVGFFARMSGAIPVERAQDLAVAGVGKIWLSPEDGVTISGRGTQFTKQLNVGDSLSVEGREAAPVLSINSDESITLRRKWDTPEAADGEHADGEGGDGSGHASAPASDTDPLGSGEWCSFKVFPHVDQTEMFDSVVEALHSGKAVGVFPEGGSHDRPSLLPLRAGVAIMALSSLKKYPSMPLKLVPVGINYFSGHRFRSRVFVDIGDPIAVPPHLVTLYLKGGEPKRAATNELMEFVYASLSALTVSAPDYETLEFFWTLRRFAKSYASPSAPKASDSKKAKGGSRRDVHRMSLDEQTELARRFSLGYERVMPDGRKWKDTERVQRVQELSAAYNARLKSLGLRDYQVAHVMTHMTRSRALLTLLGRTLLLLVGLVLWLPMMLLWIPLYAVTRSIAQVKAKQALAGSSVKISGRDVLATWKLMVSFFAAPCLWMFYTFISGVLAEMAGLNLYWQRECMLLTFFFFPLLSFALIFFSEAFFTLARSLVPLAMLSCRPGYADEITSQREALASAMGDLLDGDLGFKREEPDPESGSGAPRGEDDPGVLRPFARWASDQWGSQWRAAHASAFRRTAASNNDSVTGCPTRPRRRARRSI